MPFNSINFQFNNKEPIYLQIVELVKKNIATGDLVPGEKLPSVREMTKDLGVNPNTLQRAYGELERLGITRDYLYSSKVIVLSTFSIMIFLGILFLFIMNINVGEFWSIGYDGVNKFFVIGTGFICSIQLITFG